MRLRTPAVVAMVGFATLSVSACEGSSGSSSSTASSVKVASSANQPSPTSTSKSAPISSSPASSRATDTSSGTGQPTHQKAVPQSSAAKPSAAVSSSSDSKKSCGVVAGLHVYAGGGYSCVFAMNVMRANFNGQDLSSIYSPTTHQHYAVYCQNLSGGGGGGQRSTCQVQGEADQNKLIWATP